jgi:hypothetical protein
VSNRTSCKPDYTDQHIGSRNRSKMQNVDLNNLKVQKLFFPLHNAILFQGYGMIIAKKMEMITAQFISVWWNGMISIRLSHG